MQSLDVSSQLVSFVIALNLEPIVSHLLDSEWENSTTSKRCSSWKFYSTSYIKKCRSLSITTANIKLCLSIASAFIKFCVSIVLNESTSIIFLNHKLAISSLASSNKSYISTSSPKQITIKRVIQSNVGNWKIRKTSLIPWKRT